MLRAWNLELDRFGTRSDEEVAGFECRAVDDHAVSICESRLPVEGVDTLLGVAVLTPLRNRIGERAFEGNQLRPADPDMTRHASAAHAPHAVNRLNTRDQHLLRITAPQRTGAAERSEIDDRGAPASGAHTHRSHHRCRASSNNHEVV